MGWGALAAVLAGYAVSQRPEAAAWTLDARTKLASVLPQAMAQKLAPPASAGTPPAGAVASTGGTAPAAPTAAPGGAGAAKPPGAPGAAPGAGPPGKRAAPPAAPVLTDKVKTANIPLRLDGVGSVQARSTVAIKARIDGQLMEAAVKEGQSVNKGDLLFKLDARPLEAALKVAEANLARDKANLEKAKSDFARIGDLASKGFSPKSKYDESRANLGALEATVKADEAAIDAAKVNMDFTVIRAPINGRVGNVLVHPGNMVKANDTQSLIVITEVAPVYVAFAVPERYLGEVKRLMAGGKVAVDVWTPEQKADKIKGELFFMNNAVDTATGTITLMATFANADQKLMPGQFVQASALLGMMDNVVTVPSRAVQIGQRGTFLFVVKDDMTAEMRPVKVGETVDEKAIIISGVAAGETIVTEGQLRVIPGAKVAPKDAAGPAATPAGAKPKEQT
jgi:membrane fusion protein, multidrug efflux system